MIKHLRSFNKEMPILVNKGFSVTICIQNGQTTKMAISTDSKCSEETAQHDLSLNISHMFGDTFSPLYKKGRKSSRSIQ